MQFLEISAIEIRPRIRSINQDNVRNLEETIASKGLLHAPVIARDEKGIFLVAGEHRILAMTNLHNAERTFFFDGIPVPVNQVPVINVVDLDAADILETEIEENTIRVDIPWQDRARGLAAIHAMRVASNPRQTIKATATEIAQKRGLSEASNNLQQAVRNATILAQHLHRPSVAKARNATEALGILLKEENNKVEAELIKRKQLAVDAAPLDIKVIHGSLVDEMPLLDQHSVDLICADLPYGINADKGGFRSRTVEHHNYDDSFQNAQALMQAVIVEGFRVTKPRANLFIFGDIDLFSFFKEATARMGWKPFRTPIVWQKSEGEGLAPWGREGFRRTYELIFFATKGGRGLLQSPIDILRENRVSRALRRYGPEKPIGLMEQLIECATMPGEVVLDPCCGAGSTLAAARRLKRKAIGIELDQSAYNMAVVAAVRDPDGMEETESPTKLDDVL